jgi:hypothetical protein
LKTPGDTLQLGLRRSNCSIRFHEPILNHSAICRIMKIWQFLRLFWGIGFLQATQRGHVKARSARPDVAPPGPFSFHTASRHASWPGQRRRLSLRSFFGKNVPIHLPGRPGPLLFRIPAVLSVCQVSV